MHKAQALLSFRSADEDERKVEVMRVNGGSAEVNGSVDGGTSQENNSLTYTNTDEQLYSSLKCGRKEGRAGLCLPLPPNLFILGTIVVPEHP
jgi:hypothetical protein